MRTSQDPEHSSGVEASAVQPEDLLRLADAGVLYAVIDACDAPEVPAKVLSLGSTRGACLYRGYAAENFGNAAPYLAKVDRAVLAWITQTLWDQPWGIFLSTPAEFPAVSRHLRRFLTVTSPHGEDWSFRYYDPRLLAIFLSSCNPSELVEFFGEIEAFIILSAATPGQAMRLSPEVQPAATAFPHRAVGEKFRLREEHLCDFRKKNFGDALIRSFAGTKQTARRDPENDDILVTDAHSHTIRMLFDRRGFIRGVSSPLGRTWHLENDHSGKLLQLTTPSSLRTQMRYDRHGRPERVFRDGGELVHAFHDEYGRLAKLRFPDQTSAELRYRYTGAEGIFDENGQYISAIIDRLKNVETFEYDDGDDLIALTDGNGHTTQFEYGQWRRPDRVYHPDGSWEAYSYDPNGLLERITSQSGCALELTYDDAGHITALRGSDGTEAIFVYDNKGHVIEASNAEITIHYQYDDEGRVIEEDQGGEVIRYTYDECGSLIRLTYPTGETITYERDADLRLSCLTDWLGRRYEIAYADDDRGWTLTAPSGLITVTRQSAVGLTTSIIVQRAKDASVLFQSKLTYDHEDRVSRFHDSRFGLRRYVYDSEGQLLAAEKPATPYQNETFAYDRAGNRTRCNDESATFNSLNQLVTQGTVQCAYDDRGSMTARSGAGGGWKYTYNSRNQMIGAEGEHGQSISYGYDAFGRRIWKKQVIDASNSSLTRYVWAGEQIVREVTVHTIMTGNPGANGKTLRKHSRDYLYWLQSYIPLLMRAGGEVYQYHTDHLGTPRRLTDERGGVVWEADYVAYGEARITVNTVAQPWRFPGQYEDAETGLHYNRFRYYDPVLGKYLTRDPVSFLSGLNLYCYCHNNPVNEADPLGLWPSWVKKVVPVVAAVAVAAVVVATAPVSVPIMATVFAAGVAAGAAFGALSEGFENGFSCLSCVGGAALKGGVIGGLAALPFAFLPAAAGYAAFMGVGALSGGIGYVADWWDSGADPDNWSWIEFAGTVGLSAVTAGAGRYLGRRLGNRWRVPTTERIFRSARVRRAMREAWDDSLPDDPTFRHEEGGYIVRRRNGRLDVERWPRGNTDIISAPLIDDKGRYKGQLVVGRFHTHPHPAIDQYDRKYVQGPSQEDIDISKSKGYSHSYVIGRNEIWRIDNTGNVENIGKRAKWLSP